jgi:LmbE family N-acetylglucosaminyl deacetylase
MTVRGFRTRSFMLVQAAYRWKKRIVGDALSGRPPVDLRELGRNAVVLSPHLDDAVFSLGATIARLARLGADVTVLTVFGGDPESSASAGEWDRRTGFETAAQAAAARRVEDRKACSVVGAVPTWHRFVDAQYSDGSSDADLTARLAQSLSEVETLFIPGFPLKHPDHARLTPLVLSGSVFSGRIVLYAELPYALWAAPATLPDPLRAFLPKTPVWRGTSVGARDIALKMRACRAYSSQIPCFPERIIWRMARHELISAEVLALLGGA